MKMLSVTPFCHPSVMMRAETLRKNNIWYDHLKVPTEDHDMWVKLAPYGRFHNLPESLLIYRIHTTNSSYKERTQYEISSFRETQLRYIRFFFKDANLDHEKLLILHRFFFQESGWTYSQFKETGRLLEWLYKKKLRYPVTEKKVFDFLGERYFYRCTTSTHLGIKSFALANRYEFVKTSLLNKIKLLMKAILKFNPGG
jgi:hypothetical protein